MKKIFLIILIFGLYCSKNVNSQTQVFELVNNTGKTITEVYMSPGTVYKWESNLIKDKVAPNGTFNFSMPMDDRSCSFDFKYITDDGITYMRSAVNMCQEKQISFSVTDKTYDEHLKTQYEK